MTITKTVGSVQPYASATFQRLASGLAGADGYLAGAETSDNGTLITVAPFKFIQRGIVVENDVATTVTPPVAPIGDGPWFVTGSTPDDNPLSGANLAATRAARRRPNSQARTPALRTPNAASPLCPHSRLCLAATACMNTR